MDTLTHGLLTYLLHSTLLLGAAAVLQRALGDRRLALQEALLRAALLGGVVTASAQIAFDLHPLGGALRLPHAQATAPTVAVPLAAPAESAMPSPLGILDDTANDRAAVVRLAAPSVPPSRSIDWTALLRRGWRPALLTLWAGLAAFGFIRLALATVRLRRLLSGRRELTEGEIPRGAPAVAQALGLLGRVRMSAAPRLAVPIATGVRRPEVCLPTRVLNGLAEDQQVALCAHELAHLARRDPAWLIVARVIEAFLPMQPLNHWARRRLGDLAECLSDDLAVAASARPLGLARSLVDVASWTVSQSSFLPATAAGAFGARSRLAYRVERLMDPKRALERPRRLWLPLAGLAILATALVTPVVSGNDAPQPASADEAVAAPQSIVDPVPPDAPVAAEAPLPPPPPVPAKPHPVVAPKGAPAPRSAIAPMPPPPPPAPPAPEHDLSQAGEHLERLARRIEKRVERHAGEMEGLETHIAALASAFEPKGEELARLIEEITEASVAWADAVTPHGDGYAATERRSEKRAEARERMARLREQIAVIARSARPSAEQLKALREQARSLADSARPTEQELSEIRHLVQQAAHETIAQGQAAVHGSAEAAVRAARAEARRAQEQARAAQEEARRANEDLRRALAEAAHAQAEALKQTKRHAQP